MSASNETPALRVRGLLGLTVAEFARLLAVNPSSVYRWQLSDTPIDGLPGVIVRALDSCGLPRCDPDVAAVAGYMSTGDLELARWAVSWIIVKTRRVEPSK